MEALAQFHAPSVRRSLLYSGPWKPEEWEWTRSPGRWGWVIPSPHLSAGERGRLGQTDRRFLLMLTAALGIDELKFGLMELAVENRD